MNKNLHNVKNFEGEGEICISEILDPDSPINFLTCKLDILPELEKPEWLNLVYYWNYTQHTSQHSPMFEKPKFLISPKLHVNHCNC